VVTPGEGSRDDPLPAADSRRALRRWLPRVAWAVGGILVAVAALPFVTRGVWAGAPRDAEGFSDQPIPSLGTVALLALLVTLPYLVCPIALVATVTVVDQQVEAATVRGNRSVRLDRLAHVGAAVIRWRRSTFNLFLRDIDGRRLIIVTKTAKDVPDDIRQAVVSLAAAHPAAVSARARAHLGLPDKPAFTRRTILGSLTVVAWISWTFMMLAGVGLYLWLLG
jgi:hypothetical protein